MSAIRELTTVIGAKILPILRSHFATADVTVAVAPTYEPHVDDDVRAFVIPISQSLDRIARDVVDETTSVQIAICKYTASDDLNDVDDELFDVVAEVQAYFVAGTVSVGARLYNVESCVSLGASFNATNAAVDGGLYDRDAIASAFTFQTPIVVTLKRHLKLNQ